MSLALYKQQYIDRLEYLAGDQHKALLPQVISQSEKFSKKGETVFTDGIRPLDPVNDVAFADYETYKRLSEAGGGGVLPDYATYLQSLTDHKRITEQRSALLPRVIDWARWFDMEDEVGQFMDPKDDELMMGMAEMESHKDFLIMQALTADNVLRGKGDFTSGLANVAMPAGQIITAAQGNRFSVEDATSIEALFKNNWVGQFGMEQIYVIISPNQAKLMKDNDVQVTDKDFVSASYFELGGLPTTFSIKYIEHPGITQFAKAANTDIAVAFTSKGCIWNQSAPRKNSFGESPSHKFSYVAQMKEIGNAVRQDDLRVAWVNIA